MEKVLNHTSLKNFDASQKFQAFLC